LVPYWYLDIGTGDQLMAALATVQSIMWKIQRRALLVSRAVILLGMRWSSSPHLVQIAPIVQTIVVAAGLGGITTAEQSNAGMKGDNHLLQQIQHTQNKTAKQRRDMIQKLTVPLFE
jgi:hypothetical protein